MTSTMNAIMVRSGLRQQMKQNSFSSSMTPQLRKRSSLKKSKMNRSFQRSLKLKKSKSSRLSKGNKAKIRKKCIRF